MFDIIKKNNSIKLFFFALNFEFQSSQKMTTLN